ncbi:MAG: 2-oxo acid dehydrogenase subunit E2 [Saprospiraceae bacterium]|nr:2-oxo acid dehydrogenase subunit E2 [Saprospiraceae bacterium]
MAQIELLMPKMGESIMEATVLRWIKNVGDSVEIDEPILEIATDKVDSEIPSPVSGTIKQLLFKENDIVPIGQVIALIETSATSGATAPSPTNTPKEEAVAAPNVAVAAHNATEDNASADQSISNNGTRFYSPLVKNIAKEEKINISELESIAGTGAQGRVTKKDILQYVETKQNKPTEAAVQATSATPITSNTSGGSAKPATATSISGNSEIIEMDRMRRMIADHMVMSKQTSPHVTSYVEVDMTNIVQWRDKIKEGFKKKNGENITFTPIFIEAVAKAIRDFPMINISVDGYNIILKKDINIGMAAALPTGNLIVPVIKNADRLNLIGLTSTVNDLANRARQNKLKPEEIQGGTFTLTNVGSFGSMMGTPIINQPQVAILAVGAIKKKPAVLETTYGDVIAIRNMMIMSLSYDHRVVDGSLGGSFLKRVADYLEGFDSNQII